MFPLPPFHYFESGALLISLIMWRYMKKNSFRWFPLYLLFIVAVELTARYIRKELHQPNVWLYNLSIPIEYLFISYIFFTRFRKDFFKSLASWFIILFSVFVMLNLTILQGISVYNSNILMVGSFFMIVLSLLYFYQLYDTIEGNLYAQPMFWFSIGVLFFNAGEFSYNLLSNYLINAEIDRAARFFASINNKLIYVLYTCLIISFLCTPIIAKSRKG